MSVCPVCVFQSNFIINNVASFVAPAIEAVCASVLAVTLLAHNLALFSNYGSLTSGIKIQRPNHHWVMLLHTQHTVTCYACAVVKSKMSMMTNRLYK